MGLIQAVAGSIGGTLADQWKDFYTVPDGLPATAALLAWGAVLLPARAVPGHTAQDQEAETEIGASYSAG